MTAAGTLPDAWTEFYRLSIFRTAGTAVAFEGLTEDLTPEWGDKDIESVELGNGGRVVKKVAMTDESITLKVYPVDADIDGNGFAQWFHPQSSDDEIDPIVVDNTTTRNKHRLCLLWAETLPATATTVPATSNTAYRIQIVNAYMTAYKLNYDDKIMSAEVTFKWAPFDKSGNANKREESTVGVTALAAAGTALTSL